MSTDHTPKHAVLTTQLASLAAVVGVMVLIGWAFDIAALKSILPGCLRHKCYIVSMVNDIVDASDTYGVNPI